MGAVGVQLGAVVGGDRGGRRLEGGAQRRGNAIPGGRQIVGRHPQPVDRDPVEPLGELAQSGVSAVPHLGEDGPHRLLGPVVARRRRGEPPGQVAGDPPQVESGEQARHGSDETTGVSTNAELSSAATLLADLTARITAIAEGLQGDERDALADGLFEVERALGNAQRRLNRLVETAD